MSTNELPKELLQRRDQLTKLMDDNPHAVNYTICGVALFLGILLCVMGKKTLRAIVSIALSFAAVLGTYKLFDMFAVDSDLPQWAVFGGCAAAGIIAMAVSCKCIVKKFVPMIISALAFACMLLVAWSLIAKHANPEFARKPSVNAIISIVAAIIGAVIGAVVGLKENKAPFKIIGAVFGSFLVVASIGYVMNQYFIKYESQPTLTGFDLIDLLSSSQQWAHNAAYSLKNEAEELLKKAKGDDAKVDVDGQLNWNKELKALAKRADTTKNIIMACVWAFICLCSLVFQFKSKKDSSSKQKEQSRTDSTSVVVDV